MCTEGDSHKKKSSMVSIDDIKSIREMLVYLYDVIKRVHKHLIRGVSKRWWMRVLIALHAHSHLCSSKTDFHPQRLTRQVLWSASFFFFLLYWQSIGMFSFSCQFICSFIYIDYVQFSTTSTSNKCIFFCMCVFNGHMRRYYKPT